MGFQDIIGFVPAEIVYRPIVNLLSFFMWALRNHLGWSIVALTIVVRLLLLRSSSAGNKLQGDMAKLQPRLKEIQEKYEGDNQKIADETMKLFRGEGGGGSPLKGCLGMFIQIPLIYGLFAVINTVARKGIETQSLYSFFQLPFQDTINKDIINHTFLGLDLLENGQANGEPAIILAIIVAAVFFIQMKLTQLVRPTPKAGGGLGALGKLAGQQPNMPDMSKMMKLMNPMFAFMMGVITYTTPSAVGLYFAVSTLFALGQFMRQYRVLLGAELKAFVTRTPKNTTNKKTTKKTDGTTVIDISDDA